MVSLPSTSPTFGRYELLEYLGSGAMSDVFVAMHLGLSKRVALKMLRPSLRHDRDAVERFSREGACAARATHPNVVAVTDYGTHEGVPFLVMELLEGITLEDKLAREGPLSLSAAVDLILPIMEGVAAIHAAGVLHRDIKPANVLLAELSDGRVVPKLVDFGIATIQERRNITGALGPIGTPHYMSPEQARGLRSIDEKSDQYSLASMLFECLVGREPFAGGDVHAVLTRVARGRFPKVRDHRSSLPAAIDVVIARATAYDPGKRFPNVLDFAHALVPFASARTRRLWVSREGRTGLLSTHLLSGVWRVFDEGEPTEGAVTTVRSIPSRGLRLPPLAVAALALSAGMLVGSVAVGTQHAASEAPRSTPTAAAIARGADAPLAQAPVAPAIQARMVSVSPPSAVVELDDRVLGRGEFLSPVYDDESVHELRITAEGYVTRVVLFRKTYPASAISLEPISP